MYLGGLLMKICVFGAASPKIDPMFIAETEAMGAELARRGHTLVFGGGGNGLMGAVARGAKSENGEVVGIIPKFFEDENIESLFSQCDDLIETDSMRDRKMIMEEMSDAFIIVPGGIGTFEEFFEVLTLKQLRRHDKPIAIYNIAEYYKELQSVMDVSMAKGFINDNCKALYRFAYNTQELFDYIEESDGVTLSVKELKDG